MIKPHYEFHWLDFLIGILLGMAFIILFAFATQFGDRSSFQRTAVRHLDQSSLNIITYQDAIAIIDSLWSAQHPCPVSLEQKIINSSIDDIPQ